MCWIGYDDCMKKAKDDIIVFKAMYKEMKENKYYSPLIGFEYIPNKLYQVDSLNPKPVGSQWITLQGKIMIEKGLHSFDIKLFETDRKPHYKKINEVVEVNQYKFKPFKNNITDLSLRKKEGNFKLVFMKCIMPKNTIYYEINKEIVSTKLIMTDTELYYE